MAGFTLRPDAAPEDNAGIWSPYGPEPTTAEAAQGIVQERYKIRLLTPARMQTHRKAAMQKVWQRHQQVEDVNEEEYNERLWDDLIEGWEGVYLDPEKRQPAPCERPYKIMLMRQSLDRQNFVILQASLYANDDAARLEAQRRNFRPEDRVPAAQAPVEL